MSGAGKKIFDIPTMLREASVVPSSFDEKSRTAEVIFSTGSRVLRGGFFTEPYWEELSMEVKSVRMDRLNGGAPLLNNHNADSLADVIGVIESATVDGIRGIARIRFSEREDVRPIVKDVQDGIIRNISVGYQVFEYEEVSKKESSGIVGSKDGDEEDGYRTFRAVDWEPMEISLVGIPADAGAQVRQEALKTNKCRVKFNGIGLEIEGMKAKKNRQIEAQLKSVSEEAPIATETLETEGVTTEAELPETDETKTEAIATETAEAAIETTGTAEEFQAKAEMNADAELKRVIEILKVVEDSKLDRSLAKEWVEAKISIDRVRDLAIDELKKRDQEVHTRNVKVTLGDSMQTEKRISAAENAICHRLDSTRFKLSDDGMNFRNMSAIELCKDFLEVGGISTRNMPKMEIAKRALHDSADFPLLLANVANKFLKDAYQAAPQTFMPFTKMVQLADFKERKVFQLGNAPALEKVLENGEFKRGTISEAQEKYALDTYGKVLGMSRQMIVNDDLSSLSRIPALFGRRARDLESNLVWGIITANAAMGDGIALFHASHGNLSASSDAISVASIGAGRASMRKQIDLDGELINLAPEVLVVPASKETLADQFVSSITPTQGSEVNPFANRLKVLSEPRLDASSLVSWYLFTGVGAVDMVELAHLQGESGPVIETRVGFDVDGMEIKARMDVAAKAIDWRGMYKNPGA